MKALLALSLVGLTVVPVSAQSGGRPNGLVERARGAKKIVVATVEDVQSNFDVNDSGDRLIVSHALMRVDETMKGPKEPVVTMTVEGGTVGELTLSVSDMPVMAKGDRAVVFLDESNRFQHVPRDRGLGVLKLDPTNHVEGTTTTLDEIRSAVSAAQR